MFRVSRRNFILSLVGSLVLPIAKESRASITPIKPFSFAFISDIHLTHEQADTYVLFNESQLFLQDAVKAINSLSLDFVVFGGDMIETPGKNEENWNLFLDVLQNLNCSWDFVLGESDIAGTPPVDKMRMFGPDWKGKGLESGTPYWSRSPAHNVHLIGLDTSKPNSKTGMISDAQLSWLKSELDNNKTKFTIIFSHHPFLAPKPFDGSSSFDDYSVSNGGDCREILASSAYVRMALSGHVPVSKVEKEGNIYYVSCPGLVIYPCAFKVFRVSGDEIVMETHQISYKALVKKAEKALLESPFAYHYNRANPKEFVELCAGSREDANAVLPFYGGMIPQAFQPKKEKKKKAKSAKSDKRSKAGKAAGNAQVQNAPQSQDSNED